MEDTVAVITKGLDLIIKKPEILYDMIVLYGGTKLLKTEEYGLLHGVGRKQIAKLCRTGLLPHIDINDGYLISEDEPYPVKKRNRNTNNMKE